MSFKVYLNIPLRKVPLCGLFKFDGLFYRRGRYSHSSRSFLCVPVSNTSCYVTVVNLCSSFFVDFYKEL